MTVDETEHDASTVRTIFIGIMIGMALAAISQTLVTTTLPTMVGELGGLDHLSWVVSAYLLTSTVVVPFAGKLADLFGTTRLFQVAIVMFAAGSLLAGLSTSMAMLIAGRSIQGLGGGAIMTLAFTLVGHIVPMRERGRYQGYVASMFAVTSVIGPLLGGFFVDHLSWRWAFYSNVALAGVVLAIIRRNLPPDEKRAARGADLRGGALLVVTLISMMLVAVWGGQKLAWTSPAVVVLIAVALGGFVLFVRCERAASEPIVPIEMFGQRAVRTATTIGFMSGIAMFGVTVYAPTFLQVSLGVSATRSGMTLVPLMGCILVASTVGGRVMSRTARFKSLAVIGSGLLVVGTGSLATMTTRTATFVPSLYVGIVGLGLGLIMPVTLVAVQNAVTSERLGAATSVSQTTRKIGSTLGVAAFGGVFNTRVAAGLDEASADLPPGTAVDSLLDSPAAIARLPDVVATIVRDSVAEAAVLVFAVACAIAVLGFLVSLRLPNDELVDDDPNP